MITLKRIAQTVDGTFGAVIGTDGHPTNLVTLERPWADNDPEVSCIPPGDYPLIQYNSPKHGPGTWMLQNVPGRQFVEIHIANVMDELEGCIAAGEQFGMASSKAFPGLTRFGIINSRVAIYDFYKLIAADEDKILRII